MPRHKSNEDSLERRVIETPSLSRADYGIVNEGFDSVSSPSFFYVEDSNSWVDPRRHDHKRFTESWIELDRAYSCGSSLESNKSCRSSCCCCCKITCAKVTRWLVYLLVALSVIGFAAIVSAILYMEIFHKFDYEWHPLKDTDVFAHDNHQHMNETVSSPVPPISLVNNVTVAPTTTTTTTNSPIDMTSTIKSTTTLSKQLRVSSIDSVNNSNSTESSLDTISSSVSEKVPDTNVTTRLPSLPVTSSSTRLKVTSINNTAGSTQKLFNVTSEPKVVTNTPVNLTLF